MVLNKFNQDMFQDIFKVLLLYLQLCMFFTNYFPFINLQIQCSLLKDILVHILLIHVKISQNYFTDENVSNVTGEYNLPRLLPAS